MPSEIAAESHHRVKNTLQSIVALISILGGAKGHLDSNDVKRLLTHVYNLSSLHDALYEAALTSESLKELNLGTVCTKILQRFECEHDFTGTFLLSPRIVSTVCLIISDVITALSMQSVSQIECIGFKESDTEYAVQFRWADGPAPAEFLVSPGLQLAKLVLSSEIKGLFVEIGKDSNDKDAETDQERRGVGFVIRRQS